jgi:hypothetical protein
MDEKTELLRHAVATVAYRAARALNGAPEDFGSYTGAGRKPVEILAHMGDLFEWALTAVRGEMRWHVSTPLEWEAEKRRFFAALTAFDAALAEGGSIPVPIDRLMQGPVADALTHVGQLAMLRRLAGCPARSENMYVAAIEVGRAGAEQAEAIAPFR